MRALAFAFAAGAVAVMATPAAADAVTTRIETRPFYGATVTLEEGVRVFRPLPRHDRVIINPGGQTPLSLGMPSPTTTHSTNTAATTAAAAVTTMRRNTMAASAMACSVGGIIAGAATTQPRRPRRPRRSTLSQRARPSVQLAGAGLRQRSERGRLFACGGAAS